MGVSGRPPCRMEFQQQPLDLSVRNKIFENYEIYSADENEPMNLTKSNDHFLLKCPSSYELYCDIPKTENEEFATSFTACDPYDLSYRNMTLHQPFSDSETFWSSNIGNPNSLNLHTSHYIYKPSPFTDITNTSNYQRSSPMK